VEGVLWIPEKGEMMRLRELKSFLREHKEVTSISLTGKSFPRWPWEPQNKEDGEVRAKYIREFPGRFVTVFFHKG